MNKKVFIIGSGFSSLAASCYLAKMGYAVEVFEKNETIGGRARRFTKDNFNFDMGPTWYWMPDVFEKFFSDFNKKVSDYYTLQKLSPAYKVYFDNENSIVIDDNLDDIAKTFESIEKNSGSKLQQFIANAKDNYNIAIKDLVYLPGDSPLELVTFKTLFKINQFFSTISKDVRKKIKDNRLRQILEFPVLFLGAKPSQTPSFYNFMNYADFGLGTWHPKNGMYSVVDAIKNIALEQGVLFHTNANVQEIVVQNSNVKGIIVNNEIKNCDIVLSGADYAFTETLLPEKYRMYNLRYWNKKIFAPSALLFYVAFSKKIENVAHHTLFFDVSFDEHSKAIYDKKEWPKEPLFYASFPSVTDNFFAPEGKESATFLIPIAPDLEDNLEIREHYFNIIIKRLEKITNQNVKDFVIFKESYCVNDFVKDYNSFKGNAYGLANTLLQTAFLRPKIKSNKVKNLYFTGQLTVPGPGVPPSLISGKIAADKIFNDNK